MSHLRKRPDDTEAIIRHFADQVLRIMEINEIITIHDGNQMWDTILDRMADSKYATIENLDL